MGFGGVVVGFVEVVLEVAEILVMRVVELVMVDETAQFAGFVEVRGLRDRQLEVSAHIRLDRRLEVLVRRRRKQRVAKQERS